jgi:hypothetical protein
MTSGLGRMQADPSTALRTPGAHVDPERLDRLEQARDIEPPGLSL